MRSVIVCLLLLSVVAFLGATVTEKTAPSVEEPRYDANTEVSLLAIVTETREVPPHDPLGGIHLLLKTETQVLDAYLGPAAFIKQFEITFAKGDEVKVTGSKVKNGIRPHVILVRELRKELTTLSCRRANGAPNWE